MDVIQQEVRVSVRYPVAFTTGVFEPTSLVMRHLIAAPADPAPADVVAVVDEGVAIAHPGLVPAIEQYARHHADAMRLAVPVLVIPGGEASKNDLRHYDAVCQTIHDAGLCRHSFVIAVGGGAVLDVVGYAAATAHRGIRLIRVPTTVLSQDDSAVGVKNGINAFGKKNYFGTFAPPFAVVNDFAFLSTLEDRDWLGGLSEAVKAALIRDATFFDMLEACAPALVARDASAMEQVVRRSAALHCTHIANGGDPFELGSSRPLDFGHWAAHKLEQLTAHRLRHGEAVSIGLALDCTYARLSGLLAEAAWQRIIDVLTALRLPIYAPELSHRLDTPDDPRCVLRGLAEFREHLGGELTVMLLRGIGDAFDAHDIDVPTMVRSIEVLRAMAAERGGRGDESVAGASPVILSTGAR